MPRPNLLQCRFFRLFHKVSLIHLHLKAKGNKDQRPANDLMVPISTYISLPVLIRSPSTISPWVPATSATSPVRTRQLPRLSIQLPIKKCPPALRWNPTWQWNIHHGPCISGWNKRSSIAMLDYWPNGITKSLKAPDILCCNQIYTVHMICVQVIVVHLLLNVVLCKTSKLALYFAAFKQGRRSSMTKETSFAIRN